MLCPGPKPRQMMNNINVQWYGNVDMAMHIYLINFQLIPFVCGLTLYNRYKWFIEWNKFNAITWTLFIFY